mgnify:CR=1 FL=1
MALSNKYKQRKLRILVANDNIFQILVISNSIKILGYVERIDEALNGQEALELVIQNEVNFLNGKERLYDLIFLDLDMPIKNGYEACKLIQKHYKHIQ